MKTHATKHAIGSVRWTQFAIMLAIALTAPAVIFSQSNPAPVDLGTAGDFVILAKTGITTTGVTSITGDIGVSPIAATAMTGFGLIMDPSNTFSTSSLVTGKVYAASYTEPTPTKLTTAVGDMQTAFSDAAGRVLPDEIELGGGDITGMTLGHGLYKWSTSVLVSAGGVTISGSATDVWIFQIAGDLTLANNAAVTLGGDAKAYNIFWQVSGAVTLGTTTAMKGNILSQTLVAFNTGATLDGRALAQTAVTLDANAITVPIVDTPVNIRAFSAKDGPNVRMSGSNMVVNFPEGAVGVRVTVMDVNGREVWSLNPRLGERTVIWNGVTAAGHRAGSGIYLVRMTLADPNRRLIRPMDRRIVLAP